MPSIEAQILCLVEQYQMISFVDIAVMTSSHVLLEITPCIVGNYSNAVLDFVIHLKYFATASVSLVGSSLK